MNEEKQAIEILNSQLLKTDGYDRHQKAIDIVLKLIEKQQKEIEDLKENNKKLQDKGKELIFEKQELTSALLDSIPKDKIKEQIRMVKETKRKGKGIDNYSMHYCIMRLKELLGE